MSEITYNEILGGLKLQHQRKSIVRSYTLILSTTYGLSFILGFTVCISVTLAK